MVACKNYLHWLCHPIRWAARACPLNIPAALFLLIEYHFIFLIASGNKSFDNSGFFFTGSHTASPPSPFLRASVRNVSWIPGLMISCNLMPIPTFRLTWYHQMAYYHAAITFLRGVFPQSYIVSKLLYLSFHWQIDTEYWFRCKLDHLCVCPFSNKGRILSLAVFHCQRFVIYIKNVVQFGPYRRYWDVVVPDLNQTHKQRNKWLNIVGNRANDMLSKSHTIHKDSKPVRFYLSFLSRRNPSTRCESFPSAWTFSEVKSIWSVAFRTSRTEAIVAPME